MQKIKGKIDHRESDIVLPQKQGKIKTFLNENKYGLLGTLAFHMVLLIFLMLYKINTIKIYTENKLIIEYIEEITEPIIKEVKEIASAKEADKNNNINEILKSIAVNKADKNNSSAQESIDKMIADIKNEIHTGSDQDIVIKKETQQKDSITKKEDKKINEDDRNKKLSDKNTFYSGPSSVYFELEGRKKIFLPIPVFKCEGEGNVVVQIKVDQNGLVRKAKILNRESNTNDKCLRKAALEAAKESLFNKSLLGPSVQYGTINYTFIKQ